MRAMLSVFRMRFKLETQYRGAALGGILCQIFFGLILIALYGALYATRGQDIPFGSVVTYVWLQQALFRMLFSSDSELAQTISTGGMAYEMCRPVSLYGFFFARVTAMKLVGSLMRATPMMLVAALLPSGWGIEAPASAAAFLLFLLGILMGLFCVTALEMINVAVTMRTIDNRGISAMLNLLMLTFSGNLLPLTLFPDSWQRIIRFLPYSQLLDAPIRLYNGQAVLSEAPEMLLIQGFWVLSLAALGVFMWRTNLKRIVVQGG